MKRSFSLLGKSLLSLAVTACAVDSEPDVAIQRGAQIIDELHNGGTVGFLFLPPMVPRPAQLGDVVPALPVRVEVDEVDAAGNPKRHITTFTTDAEKPKERIRFKDKDAPLGPEDDGDTDPMGYYVARWKTNDYDLSNEATYRVSIGVPGRTLGFADVDVVKNQKQFKNVDTDNYTPLVNGDILRIKFRVDRPAVDADGDGWLDWEDHCPSVVNDDNVAVTGKLTCGESATLELGSDAVNTLLTSPYEVVCGAVRFPLDLTLTGAQSSVVKVGDKAYTLGFTTAPKVGGLGLTIATKDLVAQNLGDCRLQGAATGVEGAAALENGRLLDAGAMQPVLVTDVALTAANVNVCKEQSLAMECVATDDHKLKRMPILCAAQTGDVVTYNTFSDLHTTFATARTPGDGLTRVIEFDWLGQPVQRRCPNPSTERELAEVYTVPLVKGQPTATLTFRIRGSQSVLEAYYKVALALGTTTGDGVETPLKTFVVGDYKDSKTLTVDLPKDVYESPNPTLVLHGTFDKAHTGGGTVLTGGPIDKPDLCLDVDVK